MKPIEEFGLSKYDRILMTNDFKKTVITPRDCHQIFCKKM